MPPSIRFARALSLLVILALGASAQAGGVGSRVFVVERASGSLAVYDFVERRLLPQRITGLGNLRHVTMIFSPDLRFGYLATRSGQVSRIDLQSLERSGVVFTSENSIDNAISQDGRYYVVGHMESARVSVLDLTNPGAGVREISLRDPNKTYDKSAPVKLPHLASWAVAAPWIFVPLVGEGRLAVLDRASWKFVRSIPLVGHPVYAVRSPTEREVWVSFSGEEDDAYIQVVDVDTLAVTDTFRVGRRIYHMDFTPRGSHVLVSANGDDKLLLVNAATREIEDSVDLSSPSGIFGAWRAFRIGL